MRLYDEVLNCPDTHCRKETLDKLCKEKIAEGMEKAIEAVEDEETGNWLSIIGAIRQAAKDLEAK